MKYILFMWALYAVPFLMVAFLPGWRTLLAASMLLGLPVGWAIWDIERAMNDVERDSSFADALALALVMPVAAGLVSGILARAATLFLRRWYRSLRVMLVGTLIGFFVTPAAYGAMMWKQHLKWQLPSEACLAARFEVHVAQAIFFIPAAPVFSVVPDRRGVGSTYYLDFPRHVRAFCGRIARSLSSTRATAIHIRFDVMQRRQSSLVIAACRKPADWIAPLCRGDGKLPAGYPVKLSIYAPLEYDHHYMLATQSYEDFARVRDAAAASGKPLTVTRTGNFDVWSDRYWVAREGIWASKLGDPLMLACYKSGDGLYCRAAHDMPGGLQVAFDFRTREDQVEATAAMVEDTITRIMAALGLK